MKITTLQLYIEYGNYIFTIVTSTGYIQGVHSNTSYKKTIA